MQDEEGSEEELYTLQNRALDTRHEVQYRAYVLRPELSLISLRHGFTPQVIEGSFRPRGLDGIDHAHPVQDRRTQHVARGCHASRGNGVLLLNIQSRGQTYYYCGKAGDGHHRIVLYQRQQINHGHHCVYDAGHKGAHDGIIKAYVIVREYPDQEAYKDKKSSNIIAFGPDVAAGPDLDKSETYKVSELTKKDNKIYETFSYEREAKAHASKHYDEVRVLIPVFPGTNCEFDSAKAMRDAGASVKIFVINNLDTKNLNKSIMDFAEEVKKSQIIFIPGGFSGGDEPDGSAKFITSFFRNEAIKNAVTDLLDNREGLMLGICNGFQALIKLGLVPYGKIMDTDQTCPTLTFNTIARHQSKIVRTRIASNKSPWLARTKVGDVYNVAISHGEGRFYASEELGRELAKNGQIATQYVNLKGEATDDIRYNPNNSALAVEGITSFDGRVLGKMGHSERIGNGLYKNVYGEYDMEMFRAAVEFFK